MCFMLCRADERRSTVRCVVCVRLFIPILFRLSHICTTICLSLLLLIQKIRRTNVLCRAAAVCVCAYTRIRKMTSTLSSLDKLYLISNPRIASTKIQKTKRIISISILRNQCSNESFVSFRRVHTQRENEREERERE